MEEPNQWISGNKKQTNKEQDKTKTENQKQNDPYDMITEDGTHRKQRTTFQITTNNLPSQRKDPRIWKVDKPH